jgi:hypothetical protein
MGKKMYFNNPTMEIKRQFEMLAETAEKAWNFETSIHKCEGDIGIILRNVRWKDKEWYQLAQHGLQQPVLRIR